MDATRGLHDRPTYASSMHGYRGNSTRIMSKSKEVNKYKVMEVVGVYAVSGTTKEKRQPERENQPSTNKTVAIQDNRRMVSRSKAMLNATVHRKPKNEETKKKKKKETQAVKTECRAHARNETNQGAPPDPVPVSSCAREQNNKRKRYYFYDLRIDRCYM